MNHVYKLLIILLFFLPLRSFSQKLNYPEGNGFGVGFGYGLNRNFKLEGFYKNHRSMYSVGYIHQFNGQLGQFKDEQLSNYGRTIIGRGTYFLGFYASYSAWITKRLSLGVDVVLADERQYINFSDRRFKAGGYHMMSDVTSVQGYGGKINFLATDYLMISAGYNTLLWGNATISFVPYGN